MVGLRMWAGKEREGTSLTIERRLYFKIEQEVFQNPVTLNYKESLWS